MTSSTLQLTALLFALASRCSGYAIVAHSGSARCRRAVAFREAPVLMAEAIGADGLGALLPPPDDLADEVMLRIVLQETTDQETNELAWKYLGYSFDEETGSWDNSKVFPNWRKKYPTPPDLVGVTRTYSREVDEPVLRAVQSLQKSVPTEHKNNLRQCLKPLGWKGFKMEGLTPNMTRRAQATRLPRSHPLLRLLNGRCV